MQASEWQVALDRREFLKRLLWGSGALMAAAGLTACGAATPTSGTATRPTASGATGTNSLTFAYKSDIFGLDPDMNTDTTSHVVHLQMFDTLCWLQPDATYAGGLAESWDFPDNQSIRFHLRKGVKFHNGDPFTAADVKFTIDHIFDPSLKSPFVPLLAEYDHGEVVDDYTFVAHSKEPYAAFQAVLAGIFILPKAYLEKVGEDGFTAKPVGTGPFRFVSWQKGVSVQMEANPDYWGGKPSINRLVYRPIAEDSTRIAALQNNEAQFIAAVPVDQVKTLQADSRLKIESRPGQMIYLGLDTLRYPPLQKQEVRQALNYAVNVQSIVTNLFDNLAVRLNGPFFPVQPGYDPSLPPFPYDPERAKSLLAAAGYPNGFPLNLTVSAGIQAAQNLDQVGQAIAADLGKVGVQVKIDSVDPQEAFSLYAAKKFQAYIFPWASNPTTGQHIYTLLYSKSRGYYYQNPQADALILKYMAATDPAQRAAIGKQLLEFFRTDCPWVYLYEEPDIYGLRSNVDWKPFAADYLVHFDQVKMS
jgi:peptide/nickel transport system substrate-binding protein